jgi:uncharacterized protein (DUF433 family)
MARYPLSLPTDLKQEAEQAAGRQGVSFNQFVLWAVAEKVTSLRSKLDDPRFPHVTYRVGAAGQPTPVLRGTGIRVQTIVIANHTWGMSPVEVAADYDLYLAQVQDALAFYEQHRAEIDANIQAEEDMEAAHA